MKLRGVTYLALVLMLMTIGSINSMDKAFDDIPVESADIDQDKVLAELVKIKQGGGILRNNLKVPLFLLTSSRTF